MSSLPEVLQNAFSAIQAARGFDITFAGLTITFTALGTIAICISLLPYLMKSLNKLYPEKVDHLASKPAAQAGVPNEVIAALSVAFHSLKSSGK